MENEAANGKLKCRSAEEFKTLDELFDGIGLSKRTRTMFGKYSLYKNENVSDIILWARRTIVKLGDALDWSESDEAIKKKYFRLKSEVELLRAIDAAGFIRHDIPTVVLCIYCLYYSIYTPALRHLRLEPTLGNGYDWERAHQWEISPVHSNAVYELCDNLSWRCVNEIREALEKQLTKEQYEVISARFGINDGKPVGVSDMKIHYRKLLDLSDEALSKLNWRTKDLPAILPTPENEIKKTDSLIAEWKELHKNPIFAEEEKLREKLKERAKLPFMHASFARNILEVSQDRQIPESYKRCPIEFLGFSQKIYSALIAEGVYTVEDIFKKCCYRDWRPESSQLRDLSDDEFQVVEDAILGLGYPHFVFTYDR